MNNRQSNEFNQLVDGFLVDRLSDEDLARLETMLRGNVAAQQFFLKYCQLHMDLTVDSRAADALEAFCQRRELVGTVEERTLKPKAPAIALMFQKRPAMAFAALVVAILVVLGGSIWDWQADDPVVKAPVPVKLVPAQSASADRSLPVITSLTTEGSATTMEIQGIGRVTIEGQTQFTLVGPKRARLERGRIRMRVTEEGGRGFVIETPDGDITDLGTEFGVDVKQGRSSVLAVFEGAVDLQVAGQANSGRRIERLVGGDGVLFNRVGKIDRLNFVRKGDSGTFACAGDSAEVDADAPLIADVYDNLPTSNTRRFYEIVPKGMGEDVLAYVDRLEHNWNGVSAVGMPRYLVGADYVKTFNDDKRHEHFQMTVVLNRPALLFVLLDKRVTPPDWLKAEFQRSFDTVGLDTGRWKASDTPHPSREIATGPGNGIDAEASIWMRHVKQAGAVVLGKNGINVRSPHLAGMYSIVAVEMSKVRSIETEVQSQPKNTATEK